MNREYTFLWVRGESPRAPESTFSSWAGFQNLHRLPENLLHGSQHHLGDPVPVPDPLGLVPKVYQGNAQLSPVVRIYGPRSIDQGNSALQTQSAPGPNLHLHSLGNRYIQTRGDQGSFSRLQQQGLRQPGLNIHA